jgi:hypothetical protein
MISAELDIKMWSFLMASRPFAEGRGAPHVGNHWCWVRQSNVLVPVPSVHRLVGNLWSQRLRTDVPTTANWICYSPRPMNCSCPSPVHRHRERCRFKTRTHLSFHIATYQNIKFPYALWPYAINRSAISLSAQKMDILLFCSNISELACCNTVLSLKIY